MTAPTRTGKLILRREHFGGILADTAGGRLVFLRPQEYDSKKQELLDVCTQGTSVTFFDATERGYPLLELAASSPIDLFFEITKKCSGSCLHCYADSNAPSPGLRELRFGEIAAVIRQFSDLGGFYVRLTGGEPTEREDFFDIVELIRSCGIGVALNTSGLFDEDKLSRIFALGIEDIRVSMDGPEAVNDGIRGQGTYARILRTLEGIAALNKSAAPPARLTINVVLMASNRHTIGEMIKFAQGSDAKISFGLLRPVGRAPRGEMLSPRQVVEAAFEVHKTRSRLGLDKARVRVNYDVFCDSAAPAGGYAPFPFDNSKCDIGTRGLSIDAYGRVAPCGYLVGVDRWVGENVVGRDLLEVWQTSPVLRESRQLTRPGCAGCDYHVTRCNGGCPAAAFVFEGNLDGHDPYCVRDVDVQVVVGSEAAR